MILSSVIFTDINLLHLLIITILKTQLRQERGLVWLFLPVNSIDFNPTVIFVWVPREGSPAHRVSSLNLG
jgi:hypothetical protein